MEAPDYLKKIKVVRPLAFENKLIQVPAWVGEACVGLVFTAVKNEEAGYFSVIPDDLVTFLKSQQPQLRSMEASSWIDYNMWYGGGMPIEVDEVEVLGPGDFPE